MLLIRRLRSVVLVTALAAAAVLAIAAVPAAPAAPAAPGAGPGKLAVGVEVLHFAGAGRSITATGQVTAKLTDNSGHTQTVRTTVALTAQAGGGCRVLHLDLKELTLSLLGLHAHLDRVVLDITGNSKGGVLGSLFCKLARAKVASASRASAARALNAGIRHNRNHALRFTAYINPTVASSTAASATCPSSTSSSGRSTSSCSGSSST